MPANSCGIVSARLSVWFSLRSRAAKSATGLPMTSIPPGSAACSAARSASRWIDARRVVPASVSTSSPSSNSKLASESLPPGGLLTLVAASAAARRSSGG